MPITRIHERSPQHQHHTDADYDDMRLIDASIAQNHYDTFATSHSSPDLSTQGHNATQAYGHRKTFLNMSKNGVEVDAGGAHGGDLEAFRSRDLDHQGDFVTQLENNNLHRGLRQRHIQMIAIAGAIGTGLFLGLGGSIQTGGPLGALLGYATVGLIVCAVQFALGEVAALLPVTGSFVRHAEFLVDPAFGFAIGLNIVYGNLLSVPAEISAICVLFQFWTDLNPAVFICIFIVITFAVGISFVGIYGE
jgi:amino acid transporter